MPPNHVNAVWTDEQEQALKGLIANGFTYQRAASELNDKFDTKFTRCAATGKGFRLGITAPQKPKPTPQPRKPQPYKPRPKPTFNTETVRIECSEIIPGNVTLLELADNGCRYPVNEIPPFLFCNHAQLEGSSYCPGHYRLSIGPGSYSERRASQMVSS